MKKFNIRKRFAITARGFRILSQYCPGLCQAKAGCEAVRAIQPFVTVWFSARIINELTGERRLPVLLSCVTAVLLVNFLCTAAVGILSRAASEKESQMFNWFGKIFADKQMELDFADLENADIQRQRQAAEENLYMFGNGLGQLVWGTSVLVSVAVKLVASAALTVNLFAARSGNPVFDNLLWIPGILLCIVLGGLANSRATVKENEVFMEWCKDNVWFNRVFMFFGRELCMEPERAKDVRLYEQHNLAAKALEELLQHDQAEQGALGRMSAYPALAAIVIGLANVVCYLFVAAKAFFGAFGVGSIVQYVTVLSRMGEGLQDLMFILSDNAVYCSYLQELYDYLDLPSRMYQGSLTVPKRDDNEYCVEFRDVSFRYPGSDAWALRHVNMKFRVGEKLAVVGMNGSGKTTFIKLLCRLYDPTEGEITLGGIDIRKYDYAEYMSIFSVVFQDFRLFSCSLGQNVAASAEYDEARVREGLARAGFDERLRTMPQGLNTCLYRETDADGVEISGGEAQKIALARALYKRAPFIVLDEPTAALDPVSEYEVYSRFNETVGERTAIYISHRLASCRFCDEIAVFDEGRVIQKGTHAALLAEEQGKYHALWNAQAQYYVKK